MSTDMIKNEPSTSGGKKQHILEYLENSEFRVPPLPHQLNEDGEPSLDHLYKHGGALKKSASRLRIPKKIDFTSLNLSFGGCGFLGMYHIGVMNAIMHYVPHTKVNKVCGTSAGAIAAAAIIGNVPFDVMANSLMQGINVARDQLQSLVTLPHNILNNILETTLNTVLPENIHILAQERLFISVTDTVNCNNVVLSNYFSKDHVIKSVLASARIPLFTGMLPVSIQNIGCIDGGLTSNLPQFLKNVITVSPFASNAIISPVDNARNRNWKVGRIHLADQGSDLTVRNFFRMINVLCPPTPEILADLFEAGFSDSCRFLRVCGIIDCTRCLIVRTNVTTKTCDDNQACDDNHEVVMPECFKQKMQPLWDLHEQLERNKRASFSYNLLNVSWWLATRLTPLGLFRMLGWGDYLDNPGKLVIKFMDNYSRFLFTLSAKGENEITQSLETNFGRLIEFFMKPSSFETIDEDFEQKKRDLFRKVEIKLADMGCDDDQDDSDSDDDEDCNGENHVSNGRRESEDNRELFNLKVEESLSVEDLERIMKHDEHLAVNNPAQLQREYLLAMSKSASHSLAVSRNISRAVSRSTSRTGSRATSRPASRPTSRDSSRIGSRNESRRNSESPHENYNSIETLDNVRMLTETREATMGYYMTKPNGEVVTMSLYDVSDTDPANILGSDIFSDMDDDDIDEPTAGESESRPWGNFDEAQMETLLRKLSTHEQRSNRM